VKSAGTVRKRRHLLAPAAAALTAGAVLCGCGGPAARASGSGVLTVAAAENFWGSIASQLGGRYAHVTSIVTDPNADPHEYESSPADARLLAGANYVIVNGAGYDDWMFKLLSAQPAKGRVVFNVAHMLGKKPGANPHFWYSPVYVSAVMKRITSQYQALDPAETRYFESRYQSLQQAFAPERDVIKYLRDHFAGTPVASTESIFQYLAEYLHFRLVTPYAFMKAVSEGVDPPVSSERTFVKQIEARKFAVLVYNLQTVTPLTTQIREETTAKKIPVVGISETIQPPIESFEAWMQGELDALANALDVKAPGT
jgi:zinc/manganese transport system substrate-binding protein